LAFSARRQTQQPENRALPRRSAAGAVDVLSVIHHRPPVAALVFSRSKTGKPSSCGSEIAAAFAFRVTRVPVPKASKAK